MPRNKVGQQHSIYGANNTPRNTFYNTSYVEGQAGAHQYGCFECDEGYFLINMRCVPPVVCPEGSTANVEDNTCEACPDGCTSCTSLSSCTACRNDLNYFLGEGAQAGKCVLCELPGCVSCSDLETCSECEEAFTLSSGNCICESNQYYDEFDDTCYDCSVTCVTCKGPTAFECLTCNRTEKRILLSGSCACDPYNYE